VNCSAEGTSSVQFLFYLFIYLFIFVPHTEIVKGNIKIILAVLWVLIRKFHIVDPALRNATATGTRARFASATHPQACVLVHND